VLLSDEAIRRKKKRKLDEERRRRSGNKDDDDATGRPNKLPSIVQDWNHALQQSCHSMQSSAGDDASCGKKMNNAAKPQPKSETSVAGRRLAKVNTKGMKKMTSFFTVKKK